MNKNGLTRSPLVNLQNAADDNLLPSTLHQHNEPQTAGAHGADPRHPDRY